MPAGAVGFETGRLGVGDAGAGAFERGQAGTDFLTEALGAFRPVNAFGEDSIRSIGQNEARVISDADTGGGALIRRVTHDFLREAVPVEDDAEHAEGRAVGMAATSDFAGIHERAVVADE